MRRKAIGISMAAVLLFVGANAAFAASLSHVTIGYSTATMHFHGKVSSPNPECRAHRTVRVFKKTASGPVLQAKVTTGSKGGWSADVMHPHGVYFAVTPKQKEMTSVCSRARSGTVSVM